MCFYGKMSTEELYISLQNEKKQLFIDMYLLCKNRRDRLGFDEYIINVLFDHKIYIDISQALFFILCQKYTNAKDIMQHINEDLVNIFFNDNFLTVSVYTPKWLENMVIDDIELVYESLLNVLPKSGPIINFFYINKEYTSVQFLKLIHTYGFVLQYIKEEKYRIRWKTMMEYIAWLSGLNLYLQENIWCKKTTTASLNEYVDIQTALIPLRKINLHRENDYFITCLYKVAYMRSPIDWELLDKENERYISGYDIEYL